MLEHKNHLLIDVGKWFFVCQERNNYVQFQRENVMEASTTMATNETAGKMRYLKEINMNSRDIVEKITIIIESVDKNLTSDIKWGRLTYGLRGDYHHWICGIAQTKRSINLIFHFGGILDDKNGYLIAGESFFLRKMEYLSISEVNEKIIREFVKQALDKLDYFRTNWKTLSRKK